MPMCLDRARCASPEIGTCQFKAGWGWILQEGVASTEQPYSRCGNMCMNKTQTLKIKQGKNEPTII